MRIKTKWNYKEREHSAEETASALGVVCWRLAMKSLLNMENEGYQVDTQMQRLTVMQEMLAFMLHVVDRIMYERMEAEDRGVFLNLMARRLADLIHDNAREFAPGEEHRQPFFDLVNSRMDDYAEFGFAEGEPSYHMLRYFGDCVTKVMGPENQKWVTDQIIDVESPEMVKTVHRAVRNLFG